MACGAHRFEMEFPGGPALVAQSHILPQIQHRTDTVFSELLDVISSNVSVCVYSAKFFSS